MIVAVACLAVRVDQRLNSADIAETLIVASLNVETLNVETLNIETLASPDIVFRSRSSKTVS